MRTAVRPNPAARSSPAIQSPSLPAASEPAPAAGYPTASPGVSSGISSTTLAINVLNLTATENKYEPYLENVARANLNYLFAEMLGELTLWIAYSEIENGRYRFARVYSGESWNPDPKARLTQPGVNVVAGEYLLAVNGREVNAADSVYSFFEETANKSVELVRSDSCAGGN